MTINPLNKFSLNSTSNPLYYLRQAALEEAYEIWSIMDTCYQTLEHKEYFICDDLDYVKDILSGHGFGVVACDESEKIVGNLLVKYPGISKENLGYDMFMKMDMRLIDDGNQPFLQNTNLPITLSEENLIRVLHMDSASVLPEHRGHGLECRMIAFAETLVDTSKYCYSFATVAPKNLASLKSLERNGYQVMVTKEKYDGVMRCVMMKTLEQKRF